MKKRILLLIALCLTAVFLLCSCGSGDTAETKTDGDYTAVVDENGDIAYYERRYHNDNGDITRWDVYDANERYDHYIIYEYDSSDRLAKETYYQANGIGVYYFAYSYTEEGVPAETDYVSMKEGSYRILYDSDGVESERISFDKNDNLAKYEVYQDGAWVETDLPTETATE